MASNRPLPGDITVTGIDQKSLYQWMANVTDLINELQTDHATARTELVAIGTTLAAIKTAYEAHTHATGSALAAQTSGPATTSEGATTTADSTFSDTSGSSVPATLSNSTAITLLRS